jgi:hypothetical protein
MGGAARETPGIDQSLAPLARSRLVGTETLHRNGAALDLTVLTFWQWAASDLVGNTFRGCLAEFLVAADLGLSDGVRRDWEGCDLLTPDGVRIEVKTSGYIQTWKQRRLSTPRFSIRRARAWDPTTDTFTPERDRNSDVYVFCLHHHRDKSTVDPLDVSQWSFFVLPTSTVNARFDARSSVSLADLENAGARSAGFGQIASVIRLVLGRLG